jgi:hypothetical protein
MDPKVEHARKLRYVAASFFVIALQMAALIGVFSGTESPSCLDSSDCPTGDFCPVDGRCQQCMDEFWFWYPHLTTDTYIAQNWLHNETGFLLWSDLRICDSETTAEGRGMIGRWSPWHEHMMACTARRMGDRGTPFKRGWSNGFLPKVNARFVCRNHASHNLSKVERLFCDGCFDPHLSEDAIGQVDGWNRARAEEGMRGTLVRTVSLMQ